MTMFGYNVLGFGVGSVAPIIATGGTESAYAGYVVHTFTSSGTFVLNKDYDVDYLVVAGGGGGHGSFQSPGGGGGGAGGMLSGTGLSLTAGSFTITVGAGGAG